MDFTPKGEGEVKQSPRDMNDPVDRKRAGVYQKLEYICDKAREAFGRDPRGGGFSFVGHPQVIEQVLAEMGPMDSRNRRLQKPVVVGMIDGDVVMWWETKPVAIPFRVRHSARFPDLWIVPDDMARQSEFPDRRAAAELRMAAHRGEIRLVQ